MKKRHALYKKCNSDQRKLINQIEGLSDNDWTAADDHNDNLADFDIIVWSDCNLRSGLEWLKKISPQLKPHARVYFSNLLDTIGGFLRSCLTKKELAQLLNGQELNQAVQKNIYYINLIKMILQKILEPDFNVYIVERGSTQHLLVFIKRAQQCNLDTLQSELQQIDDRNKTVFPEPPLKFNLQTLENIRNKIFEFASEAVEDGMKPDPQIICEQLVDDNLLPKCNVSGPHTDFLTLDHLKTITDSIESIKEQIQALGNIGIDSEQGVMSKLLPVVNVSVADQKRWKQFIRYYLQQIDENEPSSFKPAPRLGPKKYSPVPAAKKVLPPTLIPGLENVAGFSCFMDSILFTTLLDPSGYFSTGISQHKFTEKNAAVCDKIKNKAKGVKFLNGLQDELVKLSNIIRGKSKAGLTCYPIIQELKKCSGAAAELMSGEQQDAAEFLNLIMEIFNLYPTSTTLERAVSENGTDWTVTSNTVRREKFLEVTLPKTTENLLNLFQAIVINDYGNLPVAEWPTGPNDKHYRYSRETQTITASDALLFHIGRVQTVFRGGQVINVKNNQPVEIPEYIQQSPAKYFELQIVIIHIGSAQGGHYTAFFKWSGGGGSGWYEYDDVAIPHIRLTDWDTVKKSGSRNGTLFMYFPIK